MTELEQIEQLINSNKEMIALSDSLKKLKTNKHFRKVFIEYYLGDYATDRVIAKATADNGSEVSQRLIDQQINAIGHLGAFMNLMEVLGENAKVSLVSNERVRDIVINEEGAD